MVPGEEFAKSLRFASHGGPFTTRVAENPVVKLLANPLHVVPGIERTAVRAVRGVRVTARVIDTLAIGSTGGVHDVHKHVGVA